VSISGGIPSSETASGSYSLSDAAAPRHASAAINSETIGELTRSECMSVSRHDEFEKACCFAKLPADAAA
jgi:hypothetical protein